MASWNSGSFCSSSGSEYHLLAADPPWTSLFAATDGPSDIDAYIASPGSEHLLFAANILWTDFIAAIGGHCETDACIASAGYFRTVPSASMVGGVRILDRS
jgi:hypothetical protein